MMRSNEADASENNEDGGGQIVLGKVSIVFTGWHYSFKSFQNGVFA